MGLNDSILQNIVSLLGNTQSEIVTPAYIYSVEQVCENYQKLKEELGTPVVVSIKANHCPELLARTAYSFEDGCEFASLGELRLRAGTRKKVYINTPAYTKKLVEVAARYDAIFSIDHLTQFSIIQQVKCKGGFHNSVMLRLNFDSMMKGADARPQDHFGMDERSLCDAIAMVKQLDIKVAGLHIFCGSNGFVKKSSSCVDVVERLYDWVSNMLGYPLEVINLGGGLPADWREKNIDFSSYRELLVNLKAKTSVIHEAGRAIFGSAGYFVTEVVSVKSVNGKRFVVCDGGMTQNFLLAKTEHVIRKLEQPTVIGSKPSELGHDYTFVGSSCNRDDVIGEIDSCHYDIQVGDKIVFKNCGAYNALYTVNKFLALKEYNEYVI